MNYIWKNTNQGVCVPDDFAINYHPKIRSILYARGIDTEEKLSQFINPNVSDLHYPWLMKDMDRAVNRLEKAIDSNEKILVYGDYDVDGTTAISLVYSFLRDLHCNVDFYVPDRYTEGYGLSKQGMKWAVEQQFQLIISLDCGIKANEAIAYVQERGVDVIVCDHHNQGETLPNAYAVLDPKRFDCEYPFKELSGCGVGFKLCQGLNTIYKIPEAELFELTDLLAISIAADIVSMTGENRVLAKQGLKILRKSRNLGLRMLIPEDKLATFEISNIVFEIAPKINAAGRISHGKAAVELMVSDNLKQAHQIVNDIITLNDSRREMDMSSTTEALLQIEETGQVQNYTTVVYGSNWNKGVIGIVASRLIESYYKPTLVFTDGNNGEMVASARSVADFDVHDALESCSEFFLKFGGHPAAAGLSMEKDKFDLFREKFEKVVAEKIQEHQKEHSVKIDSVVNIDDLNKDFFNFHRKLAPFGPHNMKPVLVLKNQKVAGYVKTMGKDSSHIKFYIRQESTGRNIECIGFKLGKYADDFREKSFDIAFTAEENHWKGNVTYYLNIRDVKFN